MSQPDINMIDVRHRLRYSHDNKRFLALLLLGLVILTAGIALFIFVQFSTRLKPQHFQLTENLQIIEPVPLDQEGITKPALLNWVNDALGAAFSFNYSNMYKQQSIMRNYFSSNALQVYMDMLRFDEDFAAVTNKFFVVSIAATATPEILTSKAFKGRYAWQIQVPAQITFSNAMYRNTQEVIIQFLVWRVPETESPNGITIASFSRQVVGRSGTLRVEGGF